jgi:myo-inositol 2-dehydrogenase/D-chiro-inositol 1-dehydrogenase
MLTFAQFGAGRIGAIHAGNIAARDDSRLKYVIDINAGAAEALAKKYGASTGYTVTALTDP